MIGRSHLRRAGIPVLLALLGVGVAACGNTPTKSTSSKIGGSVTVWAEWTAAEQQAFLAALTPFETNTGITVNYSGKGSNMDTALNAAIAGGAPPDVGLVPDPGELNTLASKHEIKPLAPILGSLTNNYSKAWNTLASHNGTLYGVWFKGANKNTIWYNPAEFAAAGITSTPTSWQQLVTDAGTLQASGVTPFSLCSDIGWPIADFWQNVYLKTAGAANYNKLAAHTIPWTDPSVTTAFHTMAEIVGKPSYLLGGTSGALSAKYPDCINPVFPATGAPTAAMVVEADFVVTQIQSNATTYKPVTSPTASGCTTSAATGCYGFFPFPAPSADGANQSAIQGSGDVGMLLKPTPQAKALIKYLAGSEGASIWAAAGGFTSPNKTVPLSTYPDPVTRADAKGLVDASSFVFSLDDLQGSWEPQLWSDMRSFVADPSASSIASIEATMQSQATAALGH
ncbi:MAG: ABC transporter substrate-binding protein [Candidatus Dormibacteria bacterium]